MQNYSALDTDETNGEDAIPDLSSPRVEDVVTDKLIAEKLHQCLTQLNKEEQELIFTLFFQNKSEHQFIYYLSMEVKQISLEIANGTGFHLLLKRGY